jgi:curved DNA-binding protein CbpA
MHQAEPFSGADDPAAILGVPPEADAATLRTAWLEKVRRFPPDRCPAEFERVRDAYDVLSDPRRRMQLLMSQANPMAPLADLVPGVATDQRRFVGLPPWLEALRRRAQAAPGGRP